MHYHQDNIALKGAKNPDIYYRTCDPPKGNQTPLKKSYSSVLKLHEAWKDEGRHNLEKKISKKASGRGGGAIMKKELRNMI